ncbi:LacI family DNA-binding transcriptional regulator [Clostridiaceae bacterium 35-E11]
MSVTISDVAKEAGVSITTVSRVLNNNYPVRKETREKIEKIIKELNYKPNVAARSLILKKTSMVGVIVPGITNLFFPTIVEEINASLKDRGYSISLCNTGGDYQVEADLVENIIARNMDGMIVIDPSLENLEKGYYEEINKRIPTIIINGNTNGFRCNFVSYDEEVGTKEAFDYFLKLGHQKIAFVRGDRSVSYNVKEKIYHAFIQDQALSYKKIINVGKGNSMDVVEKAQTIFENVLCSEEKPTAVFACNDLMAVGIINACQRQGLNVPEDMSVIGFDNTLLSNITHPKITTIDLHMKDIGKTAAVELIDMIEYGKKHRRNLVFDTKLVIRESCCPCPNR